MPTKQPESGRDRRPSTTIPITGIGGVGGGGSSTEPENLPCPRCESTNTKFCYYNNYNLSQPRYFCKSCRRYWTRGGSLRNIPFGGHHRKNNPSSNSKRHRRKSSPATITTTTITTPPPPPPPPIPSSSVSSETVIPGPVEPGSGSPVNLNDEAVGAGVGVGAVSFSSLLGGQGNGVGLMGLNGRSGFGGLGLGLGFGFGPEDVGFGLGFGKCELPMVGDAAVDSGGGGGGGYDTWQLSLGGVDGCLGLSDGGDCFSWPDLAISMQSAGKGLD